MLLFPPESIREVSVQTSVYDASVAGGGGSVQVVTKSGSNFLHGGVYEYFRNEALNANDANLKAVGESRPVMRRNAYGATLGGPLRKNRAFHPKIVSSVLGHSGVQLAMNVYDHVSTSDLAGPLANVAEKLCPIVPKTAASC
jgi:hypothetical protein